MKPSEENCYHETAEKSGRTHFDKYSAETEIETKSQNFNIIFQTNLLSST